MNWSDADVPHKTTKTNGADKDAALVELTGDVLELILDLAKEYYEHYGRWISVEELRDKLEHPGS